MQLRLWVCLYIGEDSMPLFFFLCGFGWALDERGSSVICFSRFYDNAIWHPWYVLCTLVYMSISFIYNIFLQIVRSAYQQRYHGSGNTKTLRKLLVILPVSVRYKSIPTQNFLPPFSFSSISFLLNCKKRDLHNCNRWDLINCKMVLPFCGKMVWSWKKRSPGQWNGFLDGLFDDLLCLWYGIQ